MIEVTAVFQCSIRTLFYSVKIMDKFFQLQSVCVNSKLLHIIGTICMVIASKFEDIRNIRLIDAKEKIAHNKFTFEDLKITEQAILKKLGFSVNFITRADFIEDICRNIEDSEEIRRMALFFARLSLHYYNHLEYKESQIAFWSMLLAAKWLNKDDVSAKILAKCIQMNVIIDYEMFKDDIMKFKENFPNMKSAFICSHVDFEII